MPILFSFYFFCKGSLSKFHKKVSYVKKTLRAGLISLKKITPKWSNFDEITRHPPILKGRKMYLNF